MMIPIFEDNHLLVLNKPGGLLTQPSGTEQDSLERQAKAWLKEAHQKPGNVFLGAVHRIDKVSSGVVLFGKTSKALSRLSESMRSKQTRKVYWAWVEGELQSELGTLEHYVFHDDYHARIVSAGYPNGKIARLHYRVLEQKNGMTLLEIELETGRYHQIRLQFSTLGHPILGDYKYGAQHHYAPEAIALHHKRLEIPHPITKEVMIFEAQLPAGFSV